MKSRDQVNQRLMWKPGLTIREAFQKASSLLSEACIGQDPHRVTEWMLLDLLDWDRTTLYLRSDEAFPQQKWDAWLAYVQRKIEGEPVQYIIGQQQFMGLDFQVSSAVLIPRPETELLVETALAACRELANTSQIDEDNPLVIADIGTGSGAIPISIAVQLSGNEQPLPCRLLAVDISSEALQVATQNAIKHQVSKRIEFAQGDLLQPLIEQQRRVHVLVSNPPYIPDGEIDTLPKEVKQHEPLIALRGGSDGLDFYKRMIEQMRQLDHLPEVVGWEVGDGQAEEVQQLLEQMNAWERVSIVNDLAGKARHVFAYRGIRIPNMP